MHNAKHLNAGQHVDMAGLLNVGPKRKTLKAPHPPMNAVAAAKRALEEIGDIVAEGCFAHPDKLTQERIMAYALALIRVRECAGMAGMERLMNACDALAVTVSRLLEDRTSASHAKCEALTRFVAHARSMILAPARRETDSPLRAKQ